MTTTRNITRIFKLATKEEIYNGINWYNEAKQAAIGISKDLQVPLHIVVGTIAALSPNNKWKRNLNNAYELIKAHKTGEPMESVKVSCYNAMKLKAWSILQQMGTCDQVVKLLNGQKIVAFYKSIMGYIDATCIDGHSRNVYYNERIGLTNEKTNIGDLEYKTIVSAYARAAKYLSNEHRQFTAYEVQAITWVTWRRLHNIS